MFHVKVDIDKTQWYFVNVSFFEYFGKSMKIYFIRSPKQLFLLDYLAKHKKKKSANDGKEIWRKMDKKDKKLWAERLEPQRTKYITAYTEVMMKSVLFVLVSWHFIRTTDTKVDSLIRTKKARIVSKYDSE